MTEKHLEDIQKKLGYRFKDVFLLKLALTHSSYANENKSSGTASNERLEFLGDSILGMTVAKQIYLKFPVMPEGDMTKLRAELVCEKSLAALAVKLDLGECLQLGHGEEKGGGRKRPSILADAVEAVLAAVFLDGSLRQTEKLVEKFLIIDAAAPKGARTDYKSALQEYTQAKQEKSLSYHIVDEFGPDHKKTFTAEVRLDGEIVSSGQGASKKEAEQNAAKLALERFEV